MKYKMNKGEKKTDFAVKLITVHGEFISAKDAYELVDKRSSTVSSWQSFQANLSDAVRRGDLVKKEGEDSAGRRFCIRSSKILQSNGSCRSATTFIPIKNTGISGVK